MIEFNNQVNDEPYLMLKKHYDNALNSGQKYIEAMVISSFSHEAQEVDSRYVNIKSINREEFTFLLIINHLNLYNFLNIIRFQQFFGLK